MANIVISLEHEYLTQDRQSVSNRFNGIRNYDMLGDIIIGTEFTIPNDYIVMDRPVMRGGIPLKDHDGNQVIAQYIKCKDTTGKTIEFYPASLVQVAFAVDPDTGKDLTTNRIHRTKGALVDYLKSERNKGLDINQIMENLKGCRVKLQNLEVVFIRTWGITNEQATAADVEIKKIGTWTLVGEKRPKGWTE